MENNLLKSNVFSIFIPVYNAEKYLEECLNSVFSQTFTDYSVYIHDDNSEDNSYQICKKYADNNSNIVLTRGNYPLSCIDQINSFVRNCEGQFLVFLDNDDVLDCDFLKNVYESLCESKAECAIVSYKYIDEKGKLLNWHSTNWNKSKNFTKNELMVEYLTTLNIEGFRWNKICKKDTYTDNNIFIEKKYAADIPYTFELISHIKKSVSVPNAIYYYRYRSTSDTSQNSIEKAKGMIDIHLSISKKSIEYGFHTEAKFYRTYRLIRDLFGIYRERRMYRKNELENIRRDYSWKRTINASLIDTIKTLKQYKCNNECGFKFILKVIIVYLYFR